MKGCNIRGGPPSKRFKKILMGEILRIIKMIYRLGLAAAAAAATVSFVRFNSFL